MGDSRKRTAVVVDVGHPDQFPVSLAGFSVVGVHASGVTLHYFKP